MQHAIRNVQSILFALSMVVLLWAAMFFVDSKLNLEGEAQAFVVILSGLATLVAGILIILNLISCFSGPARSDA